MIVVFWKETAFPHWRAILVITKIIIYDKISVSLLKQEEMEKENEGGIWLTSVFMKNGS